MFNSKTNSNGKETASGLATIIASGTEIKGDVESKGDIRVDGTLHGNLSTTSKVLIGPGGFVHGDVQAQQAEVLGKVTGNMVVTELLCLKGNCEINGHIRTGQLQVDPTATFNGECHMGSAATAGVVALQPTEFNAAAGFQ